MIPSTNIATKTHNHGWRAELIVLHSLHAHKRPVCLVTTTATPSCTTTSSTQPVAHPATSCRDSKSATILHHKQNAIIAHAKNDAASIQTISISMSELIDAYESDNFSLVLTPYLERMSFGRLTNLWPLGGRRDQMASSVAIDEWWVQMRFPARGHIQAWGSGEDEQPMNWRLEIRTPTMVLARSAWREGGGE